MSHIDDALENRPDHRYYMLKAKVLSRISENKYREFEQIEEQLGDTSDNLVDAKEILLLDCSRSLSDAMDSYLAAKAMGGGSLDLIETKRNIEILRSYVDKHLAEIASSKEHE